MNNNQWAIKAENLRKSYRNGPQAVEVLKGIDLTIPQGDVAVIMGPSGVGKSTLLHVLGLLDEADSGAISIGGQDVAQLNQVEKARVRNLTVGFVFQFHHLLPEFTALENVLIPTMIWPNGKEREKQEYARHILDLVGLSHRLDHKPREMSGGEQQRVAVARAVVNKPKIVMADEPTGNLDKRNGEALYNLLLQLNKELEHTLLIVTHNEHMTEQAHRIIELDDGRIAGQKTKTNPS